MSTHAASPVRILDEEILIMVGDAHDAEAAIALAHVRQVHEECAVVGVLSLIHI